MQNQTNTQQQTDVQQEIINIDGKDVRVIGSKILNDRPLVAIPEGVFDRLVEYAQAASFWDIKKLHTNRVSACENMEEFINVLQNELEWHAVVNSNKKREKPTIVGRVELD